MRRGGSHVLLWTTLATVLVLLGGCTSHAADVKTNQGPPPTAEPGMRNDETCSVVGSVIDDELAPAAGVQVGLFGAGGLNTTTTAQDGSFSFSYVQPGNYQIAANHAGFETASQNIVCAAGAELRISFALKPLPAPKVAHLVTIGPLKGFIACALGVPGGGGAASQDYCTVSGADHNGKTLFMIPFEKNATITAAVFELKWDRTSSLGAQNLALYFPPIPSGSPVKYRTNGRFNEPASRVMGPSPLNVAIELSDPAGKVFRGSEGKIEVRPVSSTIGELAATPTTDMSSLIVYQQNFDVYVGLFYYGEPLNPGFTMLK